MSRLQDLIDELCPDGVEYKTLGEVCTFNRGQTITKKNSIEGPIPVVSGGTEPAYYVSENNRTGETVAVAGSGAGAGFVSYWNEPIWCGDSFSVDVKEGISITPRFLYAYLKANENYIRNKKQGAGVPHVHGKQLKNMRIPVPPLEVQRAIVRILDSFQELDDALTAEIEAREKQFEKYRDELLGERLQKMCPDGVAHKALKSVANVFGGFPFKSSEYANNGWRVIRISDVQRGFFSDKDVKHIAEVNKKTLSSAQLFANDIVISLTGDIGKVAMVNADILPAVLNQRVACIRANSTVLPGYLYHVLSIGDVEKQLMGVSLGAVQKNLSMKQVYEYRIPVPSIEVQREVVRILDSFQEHIEAMCSERDARRKQFEHYRDCLLTFPEKEV